MRRSSALAFTAVFAGLCCSCDRSAPTHDQDADPSAVKSPPAPKTPKPEPEAPSPPTSTTAEVTPEAPPEPPPLESPAWTLACTGKELSLSGRVHPDGGVLGLSMEGTVGPSRVWSEADGLVLFVDMAEHIFAFASPPSPDALLGSKRIELWAVPASFKVKTAEDETKATFVAHLLAAGFDRQDLYEDYTVKCTAELEPGA